MTEKRFTYDYEDDKYYDKGFFKDNGKELYKDELLELLNTLHEENIQLKNKLQFRDCVGKSAQILTRSDWEDFNE